MSSKASYFLPLLMIFVYLLLMIYVYRKDKNRFLDFQENEKTLTCSKTLENQDQ